MFGMDQPSSFQNYSENVTQPSRAVNPHASEGKKHLVKAAGVMGLMTLASRVLGMIRDILCAKAFGTSWQWDAFVYAFSLPNFFRRLVGEGALSSAFIPVYSELLEKHGKEEAFKFAHALISILSSGFLIFLIAAEILLTYLKGLDVFPERLRLVFEFLRYFFPYLALMSLYAVGMGILNCHRHFFAPSLGPLVLNLAWIAGTVAVLFFDLGGEVESLKLLALILLVSGFLQDLVQMPYLRKIGFKGRWIWDPLYPGLKKTVKLILPVILGFAVMQINLLVDATLAFWVGPGANSALWFGNRLMQFPLGVFAVTMGMALLPTISRQVAQGQLESAKKNISFSLRSIALIVIPCAAGLMTLAQPIVELIYQRGQFDAESTRRTAAVLLCYSVGLFAYAGQKILTPAFHAVQNTRTPVRIAVLCLFSNIVLNVILMQFLAEAGLALATSISGFLQLFLLGAALHRSVLRLPLREILLSFLKITAASAAMAATAWMCHEAARSFYPDTGEAARIVRVLGSIGAAALAYPVYCFIFRVPEIKDAWSWAAERLKRRLQPRQA
ncbi:MAG: murein biosynthesis integral membrane protein MurJ [Candidatus Omnitrophica bacterium]|nr:murein biosynthesis integral membrane protein MurJ [Candidatus Omnitrophota bacterium]